MSARPTPAGSRCRQRAVGWCAVAPRARHLATPECTSTSRRWRDDPSHRRWRSAGTKIEASALDIDASIGRRFASLASVLRVVAPSPATCQREPRGAPPHDPRGISLSSLTDRHITSDPNIALDRVDSWLDAAVRLTPNVVAAVLLYGVLPPQLQSSVLVRPVDRHRPSLCVPLFTHERRSVGPLTASPRSRRSGACVARRIACAR